MKIRNIRKTLQSFNLPTGSLHLAGHTVSRELTDAELAAPEIQKSLARRWIRIVPPKNSSSANPTPFMKSVEPVASPDQPVADAEPNTSSDSQ